MYITDKKRSKRSGTCNRTFYMSWTRDQKSFKISEVAANELMIPQCTMRPSIARISKQVDPRFAASRHTTAPIELQERFQFLMVNFTKIND